MDVHALHLARNRRGAGRLRDRGLRQAVVDRLELRAPRNGDRRKALRVLSRLADVHTRALCNPLDRGLKSADAVNNRDDGLHHVCWCGL